MTRLQFNGCIVLASNSKKKINNSKNKEKMFHNKKKHQQHKVSVRLYSGGLLVIVPLFLIYFITDVYRGLFSFGGKIFWNDLEEASAYFEAAELANSHYISFF